MRTDLERRLGFRLNLRNLIVALEFGLLVILLALPWIIDQIRPGVGQVWAAASGCRRFCWTPQAFLYLLGALAAWGLLINVPRWLWRLWTASRRTDD